MNADKINPKKLNAKGAEDRFIKAQRNDNMSDS